MFDPLMMSDEEFQDKLDRAGRYRDFLAKLVDEHFQTGIHYGPASKGSKPTLLKAGAEEFCIVFDLVPVFKSAMVFEGGHLYVTSTCELHSSAKGGHVVGTASAGANTLETELLDHLNIEDVREAQNVLIKISEKRSVVAAVLHLGLSARFTQDMESEPAPEGEAEKRPAKKQNQSTKKDGDIRLKVAELAKVVGEKTGKNWRDVLKEVSFCVIKGEDYSFDDPSTVKSDPWVKRTLSKLEAQVEKLGHLSESDVTSEDTPF